METKADHSMTAPNDDQLDLFSSLGNLPETELDKIKAIIHDYNNAPQRTAMILDECNPTSSPLDSPLLYDSSMAFARSLKAHSIRLVQKGYSVPLEHPADSPALPTSKPIFRFPLLTISQ